MKLTASMSETLSGSSSWEFVGLGTFNVIFATHTLFDWSIHVRWLTSQMMIQFVPKRSYFDSASLVFVALEPAKTVKNCSVTQMRKKHCENLKTRKETRRPKSKSDPNPVSWCCSLTLLSGWRHESPSSVRYSIRTSSLGQADCQPPRVLKPVFVK